MTRRVCSMMAGVSLARKFSPSPNPITTPPALPMRAATILSGSSADISTMTFAPWICAKVLRAAASQIQARGLVVLNKMHDRLGVGIRLELNALGDQFILQLEEVLDDAVMHYDHPLGLPEVRVGIARGGRAVRRPASMANAGRA